MSASILRTMQIRAIQANKQELIQDFKTSKITKYIVLNISQSKTIIYLN